MNPWTIAQALYVIITIYACIKLIYESEQPARTYSMLLLIIFVPVIGLIFYLFFGTNHRKKELYSHKLAQNEQQQKEINDFIEKNHKLSQLEFPKHYDRFKPVSDLVYAINKNPLTSENKVQLLINGEEKFPVLKQDIIAAKNHIHMQYFIFEDDKLGTEVIELLAQKVKEGVQVRILYDYFGSFNVKNKSIKAASKLGIEIAAFHKIGMTSTIDRLNFRTHRKIVVIDGKIGYTGGLNISNDYINDDNYPSKYFWRDTHLRIEGEAVLTLQQLFLADWNFASNQSLGPTLEFFPVKEKLKDKPKWLQIVNSGPDTSQPAILYAYIEAINSAKDYILLSTPYYIPDQEFVKAVIMAALRGVKIKLLVPAHSDSWYANAAAKSYYDDLLEVGAEIYFYKKGMFHAKTVVCDGLFSMVGTANLDYRSFDLNFEVNTMIFDEEFSQELINSFNDDLKDSELITLEAWSARPKTQKFFQKLMALLGPLL